MTTQPESFAQFFASTAMGLKEKSSTLPVEPNVTLPLNGGSLASSLTGLNIPNLLAESTIPYTKQRMKKDS